MTFSIFRRKEFLSNDLSLVHTLLFKIIYLAEIKHTYNDNKRCAIFNWFWNESHVNQCYIGNISLACLD